VFATGGIGTNRFRFGFAGLNWNFKPQWGLQVEHDGYNFNGGVSYSIKLGPPESHRTASLTAGTIRGKYLYLGLGFGF
jgi:hypothetical protein